MKESTLIKEKEPTKQARKPTCSVNSHESIVLTESERSLILLSDLLTGEGNLILLLCCFTEWKKKRSRQGEVTEEDSDRVKSGSE